MRIFSRKKALALVGVFCFVLAIPTALALFFHQQDQSRQAMKVGSQHYDQLPVPSAIINTHLQSPSNLTTLSLDSTIKANWTAPADPKVSWQVFSVWDQNGTLISSKVLGNTATAADGNGLQTGAVYMIKVQSMDASGRLSKPVTATATTDAQAPMKNAAFFENFDDTPPGD